MGLSGRLIETGRSYHKVRPPWASIDALLAYLTVPPMSQVTQGGLASKKVSKSYFTTSVQWPSVSPEWYNGCHHDGFA